MLITIGTPHRRDFTPEYVNNLVVTLLRANYQYEVLSNEGTYVHSGRNIILNAAQGEYLLFIDTDTTWRPECITALVNMNKDIAGALYFKRGRPYGPVVYDHDGIKFVPIKTIPQRAFQCAGLGAGFLLISRKVIEAFKQPENLAEWGYAFDPIKCLDPGDAASYYIGEDLSFCAKAKHLGFEIWCDPETVVGHVGNQVVGVTL